MRRRSDRHIVNALNAALPATTKYASPQRWQSYVDPATGMTRAEMPDAAGEFRHTVLRENSMKNPSIHPDYQPVVQTRHSWLSARAGCYRGRR